MPIKPFVFDNGFSTPNGSGLAFAFDRGYETVDHAGIARGPTQPRFVYVRRLLCGALRGLTEYSDAQVGSVINGSFHSVEAGGVDLDSVTPLLVYKNQDQGVLAIFRGAITAPGMVFRKNLRPADTNDPKFTTQDLLWNEGASAGASADRAYVPRAFTVAHGLVIAVCEVQQPGVQPRTWVPIATAVCSWQARAGQANDRGWRLMREWGQSQIGLSRGLFYQFQGFRILDEGPVTRVYFAFSDYVYNGVVINSVRYDSSGGQYFVLRAERSGVGQLWNELANSPNDLAMVYAAPPVPALPPGESRTRRHSHPPVLEKFGANGLRLLCPIGDSYWNASVVSLTRSDRNYADAAGWTVQTLAHGDPVTSPSWSPAGLGNQFVGSAPLGTPASPLGSVIGADESVIPLGKLAPATDSSHRLNFTRLYGTGVSTPLRALLSGFRLSVSRVWNTFQVVCKDPVAGGPFIAFVFPGQQQGRGNVDGAARVMYSPDGQTWGQCWANNDAAAVPVQFFADTAGNPIIVSSSRGGPIRRILRSVRVPAVTAARPLVVGNGGSQMLLPAPEVSNVGAGCSVDDVSGTYSAAGGLNVVPAPCTGRVYRCRVGASALPQNPVGIWKLTNPVLGPGHIKLRLWLYILPWGVGGNTLANVLQCVVGLGKFESQSGSGPVAGSREQITLGGYPTVGSADRGWIPVTLDTHTNDWTNEDDRTLTPPTGTFALGLRLRCQNLNLPPVMPTLPIDCLIAFDTVAADTAVVEHTGVSLPAAPSAPGSPYACEKASVTGFACGSSWSIELAGEVSDEAWDQFDARRIEDGFPLCTLWESNTKYIEVLAMPSLNALRLRWADGLTVDMFAANGEAFWFLRGSPVYMGISCNPAGTAGIYTIAVSVGGTSVSTVGGAGPMVMPREIRFSNAAKTRVGAMYWFGGRVDEAAAMTVPQLVSSLQNLDMLYVRCEPAPPGGLCQ